MSDIYILERDEGKKGHDVYFHDIHADGTRRRCLSKDKALEFESVLMASHYKNFHNLSNYSVAKK